MQHNTGIRHQNATPRGCSWPTLGFRNYSRKHPDSIARGGRVVARTMVVDASREWPTLTFDPLDNQHGTASFPDVIHPACRLKDC